MNNDKVYAMQFAKIYPLLVNKAVRKGRSQKEVDTIIMWLCGYSEEKIAELAQSSVTYQKFFEQAPQLNPNRRLIKGVICGIRVEDIEEPLMQEIRYLDKLVDELAKGKPAPTKVANCRVNTILSLVVTPFNFSSKLVPSSFKLSGT